MQKMRLYFLTAVFALLMLNCSLGFGKPAAAGAKQIRILASFYPMYIMAINVAKDVPGAGVTNLTGPFTGCLHDYALTTGDMRKFADADIFIANGAGMESFLDKVVAQYPHLKIVQLSQSISLIKGQGDEGDNPHVWVSISNAITQVKNLCRDLQEFDPAHKDIYQKNTDEYVSRLEALRQKMHTALLPYKGREIVTFHEAFPYFAQEFGLVIAAVVEREPGSEPSAQELARTIDLVKKTGIKALFAEPQYPAKAAEAIAKETGAKVYILDPAVTGSLEPDAYIKIMETNLETLKKAFKD